MNTELYGLLPDDQRELKIIPFDGQWEAELQFYHEELGDHFSLLGRGATPDAALKSLKQTFITEQQKMADRIADNILEGDMEKVERVSEILACREMDARELLMIDHE